MSRLIYVSYQKGRFVIKHPDYPKVFVFSNKPDEGKTGDLEQMRDLVSGNELQEKELELEFPAPSFGEARVVFST